jgi:hypothetical protein
MGTGSNTLPAVLPAVDKSVDLASMAMKLVDSPLPSSNIPHEDGTIKAACTKKILKILINPQDH